MRMKLIPEDYSRHKAGEGISFIGPTSEQETGAELEYSRNANVKMDAWNYKDGPGPE